METTNDNLIDKQLYISMQQGNKKAFDTFSSNIMQCFVLLPVSFVSLEDAEEVVQDTMLQIWENRKTKSYRFFCSSLFVQSSKNKCIPNDQKFISIPNRNYTHSRHTGTITRS